MEPQEPRRSAVDGTRIRSNRRTPHRSGPARPMHVHGTRNESPGPLIADDNDDAPLLNDNNAPHVPNEQTEPAVQVLTAQERNQHQRRQQWNQPQPYQEPYRGRVYRGRKPAPAEYVDRRGRGARVPPRNQWDFPPQGHPRQSSKCMDVLWTLIQVCAALMAILVAAIALTNPDVMDWVRRMALPSHAREGPLGQSTDGLVPPNDLIPIWTQPHRTNASMVTVNNTQPNVLWRVRQTLRHHLLGARGQLACLCMHHLEHHAFSDMVMLPPGAERGNPSLGTHVPYRRVCAVHNGIYNDAPNATRAHCGAAQQIYFMVNPRPLGRSKSDGATVRVDELSVACPLGTPRQQRDRPRDLFVEWEDERADTLIAMFRNVHAACLQLAMEEFMGNVQCAPVKKP